MDTSLAFSGTPSVALSERGLYARVAWRMIPLLFVSYVIAYLNRINVGFAKLQMLSDLKFSDTMYGVGAGVFFIGYFIFEVPSNIILHRMGARVWIARIMITWGLISAATLAVKTPGVFYLFRFALGVAEAGFFPGIFYYLTYWYPAKMRARIAASFLAGIPVSGIVGGPLSGWIMHRFGGELQLAGWQWLFLIEGLPASLMGLAVLAWLPDSIRTANWLTEDEKQRLELPIAREQEAKAELTVKKVFVHRSVVLLSVIYFTILPGLYGLSFWMPQILTNAGIGSVLNVGLLSVIPYGASVIVMLLVARNSDRTGERRWHIILSVLAASAGYFIIGLTGLGHVPALCGLILATSGIMAFLPIYWTLPSRILGGVGAAAGIALINSVGNLAGFAISYAIGALNDLTHSQSAGLDLVAGSLFLGAFLVFALLRRETSRGSA